MQSASGRYLVGEPAPFLQRPKTVLQPVLAKRGTPNIDIAQLADRVQDVAVLRDMIPIESPEHWQQVIRGLGDEVDAILPVSIPAYPTEIWNAHPEPIVERGLPFVFWPLIDFDEPDFWRWSARDMLRALGADVHIVQNQREGDALLRALAMKRFLKGSRIVVFGEQNFPWNAHAVGPLITRNLGTEIRVKTLDDLRSRYDQFDDAALDRLWAQRSGRYTIEGVRDTCLKQGLRTYLAIQSILEEEAALGMGVNCFGELIIEGSRDIPCLAQTLLREDGYIAACDGDFCAMMNMVMTTFYLDQPCMMSNMYPIRYEGALRDHFGGDPLAPNAECYSRERWRNMARLGHCGYVGVVSPEMTTSGKTLLKDWGGTWEIKRDGRGCGNAGDLRGGELVTVQELRFDGTTLLLAEGRVAETTWHPGMPHCESTALLEFRDLEGFVDHISREHTVVVYGDYIREMEILGDVLGMNCKVF